MQLGDIAEFHLNMFLSVALDGTELIVIFIILLLALISIGVFDDLKKGLATEQRVRT